MAHGGEGHRHYEDLAVSHVLGGLDETDSRLFRTHLLDCPDCRARVGELRNIAHELADVERDEQRSRAAQTLETKQRDEDDEAPPKRRRSRPRASRILTVLALAGLVSLSLWNFALRGTVARLEENLDRHSEAATLLEFGAPGLVLARQGGVEGQVKVDGDRMVVLVDGLDDGLVYGVYIQDATGHVLFRAPARSSQGRLLAPMALPDGAYGLLVTQPYAADPAGPTILQVRLPEER